MILSYSYGLWGDLILVERCCAFFIQKTEKQKNKKTMRRRRRRPTAVATAVEGGRSAAAQAPGRGCPAEMVHTADAAPPPPRSSRRAPALSVVAAAGAAAALLCVSWLALTSTGSLGHERGPVLDVGKRAMPWIFPMKPIGSFGSVHGSVRCPGLKFGTPNSL
eukprot:SAG31_NODE_1450_length_8307_cov_3.676657_9_plen_163_part_00